jgi:hypothetical protein
MWIARARSDSGQASVELVTLLPALGVVLALAWQALIAGETWWLASIAARAGARAEAVDGSGARVARASVPSLFRTGARVRVSGDQGVEVRLRIPSLVGVGLGSASARARMEGKG